MPAIPKDPILNKLAQKASELFFFDSPEATAKCKGRTSFPCCYLKASKLWVVKISLGPDAWTLGRFRDNPVNASRFADMAIRRFWKYRKGPLEISDGHLTHGLAHCAKDAMLHPSANTLLFEIEQRLREIGACLSDTEISEQEFQQTRELLSERTVAAWNSYLAAWEAEKSSALINPLNKFKVPMLDDAHQAIHKQLTEIQNSK